MLFVEPEVDCVRLHLRDLRIPIAVLEQSPDAIAIAAATGVASAPQSTRYTADPFHKTERGSGKPESGTLDAVSSTSASPSPPNRLSTTVSASTRTSSPSTAVDPQSSLLHNELEERADVLRRALLSTLYARFPYELPDTLEYVYVLVVTHHATPSISTQPLTSEELSSLTTHYDFLPAELRCRTFPSHLSAVLGPACTAAAAASSSLKTESTSATTSSESQEKRPSIRVTDGAAVFRQAEERRSAEKAAAEVLNNVPMAPRFYDSFFLLARELNPAQQALYYETQCRGRPLPSDLRQPQPQPTTVPLSSIPRKLSTSPTAAAKETKTAAAAAMENFRVMHGHFTHFIPANVETKPTSNSTLAMAVQRMSQGTGSYRRVVGESETYYLSPNDNHRSDETKTAAAAAATTATANTSADVRSLHFSVYRIPLTGFPPEDQQYYTDQREELRWRRRRQCYASYCTKRESGKRRCWKSAATSTTLTSAEQRSWWPLTKKKAEGSAAFSGKQGSSSRNAGLSVRSSSSSSSSGNDSRYSSSCSSSDTEEDEEKMRRGKGAGESSSRSRKSEFDGALRELFQSEANSAASASTGPEQYTPEKQRRATRFFETCYKVLTNYALAHSSLCTENGKAETVTQRNTSPSSKRYCAPLRPFPGVSYLGVTRLLYSLVPCDCYHLVMKDNNPLYYAHSSRASYQPQTVPLCLVSDLTLDSAKGGASPTTGKGGSSSNFRSPRVTTAAHVTASNMQNRATELRFSANEAASSLAHGTRAGTRETRAAEAVGDATRPSPCPNISGKAVWFNMPTAPPVAAEHGDDTGRNSAPVNEPPRPPLPTPSSRESRGVGGREARCLRQGDALTDEDLVRSRPPSRAPSPDRPTTMRDGRRSSANARTSSLFSSYCTDGILRVTASLVSNSISGNPQRSEKSLTEKGACVPDFLLPDAALKGSNSSNDGCVQVESGSQASAVPSSTVAAASSAAVVNLFRALAESSLAQHKLRCGSIRSVLSVAVLDNSHLLSGALSEGFTAHSVEGDGALHGGTAEAIQIRESERYCCRGLVDHTWLSIPVQRTPAEQEAIQWIPVMLGSTECVSDVGLRTAVHLGVFPQCTSVHDKKRDVAASVKRDSKNGLWPTRQGALSSLTPSASAPCARMGTSEKEEVEAVTAAAPTTTAFHTSTFAQPLQSRVVNSTAAITSKVAPSQQSEAKENQRAPDLTDKLRSSASTVPVKDPDGYAVPTSVVERKGGVSLQFDFNETPQSSRELAAKAVSAPRKPTEKELSCAAPQKYHAAFSADTASQPDTRPSSPRFSQEAFGFGSSCVPAAAVASIGTHLHNVERQDKLVENVLVDLADEEAPQTTLRSVRSARGGLAMTCDVDIAQTGGSRVPRTTPATVTTRASMDPLHGRGRGTENPFTKLNHNTDQIGGIFHPSSDRSNAAGVGTTTAEQGTTQQSRKAISWPDKLLPKRAFSSALTPAFAYPSTATASSSSWTSLSALHRCEEQRPGAPAWSAAMRSDSVEAIEMGGEDIDDDGADEFLSTRSNEDKEGSYKQGTRGRQASDAPQPLKSSTLGAPLSNPFVTYKQSLPSVSHTPPRTPASLSAFKTPTPNSSSPKPKKLQAEAFFDDAFPSASAAPSPHTPTPRFAVQLTPSGMPADAAAASTTAAAGFKEEDRPSRWRPSQQQLDISSPLPRQNATSTVNSAEFTTHMAFSLPQRGARLSSTATSPSVFHSSVSAISHTSSTKERSQNAGGDFSTQQRTIQPPVTGTTPALDEEARFDAPGEWPELGAVGQRPTHGIPSSDVPNGPSKYFESRWGARKTANITTGPFVSSSRQTTLRETTTNTWLAESRSQKQQQRLSLFTNSFGRPPTTLGSAATGIHTRPTQDSVAPSFASQRAQVRSTLGIGRLTSYSSTTSSAYTRPQTSIRAIATTAAATPTRSSNQTLFIDEYDDAAVTANSLAGAAGVRSRVRPRGVSAMDTTWWQPVRELSSAPNLRFSSTCLRGRATTATAAPCRPTNAGPTSNASMDLRLSTSADQPYNLSTVDYDNEHMPPSRDTFHVPRETLSHPFCGIRRPSVSRTTHRLSLYADHVYGNDKRDGLCRAEEPYVQELSLSPYQSRLLSHAPSTLRRTRSPDTVSATAVLGRRPPLAPAPLPHQTRHTSGHRYAAGTATAATAAVTTRRAQSARAYSATADTVDAERRRREWQRLRRLNDYQQHLQENYMCGPVPKRFCFEKPPLHPAGGATPSSHEAIGGGIHSLRHNFDVAAAALDTPKAGDPCPGFTQTTTDATAGVSQRMGSAAASSPSIWTPRTTASPPCLSPLKSSSNNKKIRVSAFTDNPLNDITRGVNLGTPLPSLRRDRSGFSTLHALKEEGPRSPSLREDGGAKNVLRCAEARLREQTEQQEHLKTRLQMEQLADGESAALLASGVNVSFTLRDIATVFLRLPNTNVGGSRPPGAAPQTTMDSCSDNDGGGLEVLDICTAAWRSEGVSCFISRKPTQLQGGWVRYQERLNLYQEPFYLREQAFILLLPVPHVPELKVCVAIHNINDVLALVCQTPLPVILPTAEEIWVQQQGYGWSDEEQHVKHPEKDLPPTVTVEEHRWFFGLFTTRRVVQEKRGEVTAAKTWGITFPSEQEKRHPQKQLPTPDDDDAMRRTKCRTLRRQHQLDGLRVTWRHRARIWYALFQAGQSCSILPACTSPLLTDPVACKARCALLCDRVAAYAAVVHRLETLKAVRQAYVERRAEELSRQRVMKLRDVPYRGSHIRLGDGVGENLQTGAKASCALKTGGNVGHSGAGQPYSPFRPWNSNVEREAEEKVRVRPCGGAFAVGETPPSSMWSELHGNNTKPSSTTTPAPFAAYRSRYEATDEERERRYNDEDVRRGRAGTPIPPTSRFGPPYRTLPSTSSTVVEQQAETPWRIPCGSPSPPYNNTTIKNMKTTTTNNCAALRRPHITPGITRAMQLRRDANRHVAQGQAPVASLRHAKRLFFSTNGDDNVYGHRNATRSLVAGTSRTNSNEANTRSSTTPRASVAPYASSTSLSPSRLALRSADTTSVSCLALGAAAESAQMDLIQHVDRDDTLARALNHLTEFRAASIVQPLTTVLSAVPRGMQPVRCACGGVVEEQSRAVGPTGECSEAAMPLDSGFVPSPVELQQRLAQPFNISIAQVQQLIQWQWDHHQHTYTLMPLPLFRGSVVPSADFSLFASSNLQERSVFNARHTQSSTPPSYAVSLLARELLVHLARWSWLLGPMDDDSMKRHVYRSNHHRGSTSRHHSFVNGFHTFFARQRGSRGRYWNLRHGRVLCLLTVFAVLIQHAAHCLSVILSIAVVYLLFNALTVGVITHLPSHRRAGNEHNQHVRGQHGWLSLLWCFKIFRPHTRRHRHQHRSPPRPFASLFLSPLEDKVPPLHHRVSLLYNLSEETTQNLLERRLEHFTTQTVVTRVLRCQTCVAALLSRLHLAFYGYSTTLSLWLALLCLSYLSLYLVYVYLLQLVGLSSVKAYSSTMTSRGSYLNHQGSALSFLKDVTAAGYRQHWMTDISLSTGKSAGEASVNVLRLMSATAWREVFEPVRFLLLQWMEAATDVETDVAKGSGGATMSAKGNADISSSGRPSYFYQNGRYYTYDAEPPAWAKSRTSPEVATVETTAPSVAQFFMSDASTAASSAATSMSARMVRSLSDWVGHVLRGGSKAEVASAEGVKVTFTTADRRAGVDNAKSTDNTGATEPSTATRPAPYNATPQDYFGPATESAEPSLLWFFVFAYFTTFCLPRSPFLWLWRRVWGVLTHDDALARRPLLAV